MVATPTRCRSSAASRLARPRRAWSAGPEQRPVGQILEVGDLNLEHYVLDGGVVGELGRQQALPAPRPARPPAEIEQQVGQGDARREHRLRTAVRPWLADGLEPRGPHVAVYGGDQAPRSDPYAAAAAWALAQASRVAGLLRSPRSTISARESRRIRSPRSGGKTGVAALSARARSAAAVGGGDQGTSGEGDAPGTPETDGVPTQPANSSIAAAPASRCLDSSIGLPP